MDQLKGEETNLDCVQDFETHECTLMENDPEVNNSLSIFNQMNMKGSDQQEFVNEAFNILTKLCDLKMGEKVAESDSAGTELPMLLYRDISNRKQKLLLEAEYEFLIINACDILSRLLDRSPGSARLKYKNKHSLKTKHRTFKDRQLKEFYRAEECFNVSGFNEIMNRECIDYKNPDLKPFDIESSKDKACNLYDSSIIKGWKIWDLPVVDDAVSITVIYDNIENDSIPDNHLISNAQFLLEQENMVWEGLFIENILAIDTELVTASIEKIPERKQSYTIIPNSSDKKLEADKLNKSSDYDDFFKPCTLIEKIPSPQTSQGIPCDNVDSPNLKYCVRKTGTRRTNRNLPTSASNPNQIGKNIEKVEPQQVASKEKTSLFSQLNQIDLSKVTAFKKSILQYIPKRNNFFRSTGEFENSLLGIGATLGLGKWWQEEFANLQKEGFYFGSETQQELRSIEKFMNTSFKEILKPVCHKQQKKVSTQPPVLTKKPKKVITNTEKNPENNQNQSPLWTKMNINLMKKGEDKKNLSKKIANDKKVENVKNAKLASVPVDKKIKVLKGQRYSAKFKTSNKLPNGKHSALRNKTEFIKVKTPFNTPFKILRTPINNYSKAPSKNQRLLLPSKPASSKNTRITLKNQKTPLKNSRKFFKKSRTPFKNQQISFKNQQISFKKSLSAMSVIPKEKINKF